ncbi:hypothetical protein JCM19232_314 [Vibrio ishigakensis]|uniref:Uncharacterized protein n=1 Tax=Vibrio ishigakensis TaxID=1481914 RepID=A0A0B8NPC9_9VIBR|nr:hypothetical protein [Vibrio ishigakensis]GAM55841.1 hypothetical protein JCM19231_3922 [Vibrio ishigakensis]GAM59981.1 hypothetical protein JCM19232_314 [Vibrio ishigakensis]GAM66146.1 hypothetical protein JCM19236_3598 [Vibrio sp. JCM 19236]GAM74166.1 hypothetical protein JCM19241_5362 [Vibrio ishigakensis]
MAQVMLDTIAVPSSKDSKSYSIDFKGLMMHLVDILFGKSQSTTTYYVSDMSAHVQKDIGMIR